MTRKKLVLDQIILCKVLLMIMSLVGSRLAPFDNFTEISYAYTAVGVIIISKLFVFSINYGLF